MKLSPKVAVTGFTGFVFGVTLAIGGLALAGKEGSGSVATQIPPTSQSSPQLSPTDIVKLNKAIEIIKKNYVEPVTDDQLLDNALHGMLSGHDPHSSYLDSEELGDLTSSTQGQFAGVGMEVMMDDGALKVVAPLDDSPAQKAGIKSGDLILKIDDTPVSSLTLMEAVQKMRGAKGTTVTLTIIRKGEDKPLIVAVVRDQIVVKSVKYQLLSNGYAYVRIGSFQAPTANELNAAINEMKQKSGGQLKGLILDLRDNPGGLLDSAVDVADMFLDNTAVIVSTKGRVQDASFNAKATPGDLIKGTPMVVLVNGGSASASEIVAGALQDEKRAIIMGQPSFGKGSVQTIIPLDNQTAVKVTTALYYTPNGRSIQAHGILPDVQVQDLDMSNAKEKTDYNVGIKESGLQGN